MLVIDIDGDGDLDMFQSERFNIPSQLTQVSRLLYFERNICHKETTCDGRGTCEYSNKHQQSICRCKSVSNDVFQGSHCESCPFGTVEKKLFGGSNLVTPQTPECVACSAGRWNDRIGYFRGVESCTLCKPGYYGLKTHSKNFTQGCSICPIGYTQPDPGTTFCLPCEPGTANALEGQQLCQDCEIGKYKHTLASCEKCPTGYYQPKIRTAYCLPCLPGLFQESEGKASCDKCPNGWLQGSSGQTLCTEAKQNAIVLGDGSASVLVPKGSYLTDCTGSGQFSCKGFENCPQGWIASETLTQSCKKCDAGMNKD
mgnify:CR=1 FL=1